MKLLIVEDDKAQCTLYEEALTIFNEENQKKIEGDICRTREEGLKAASTKYYDGAIIDINLGNGAEIAGNDVIKEIFSKQRIPIYILSGTPDSYIEIPELRDKKLLLKIERRGDIEIIELFNEMYKFYSTGLTKILNRNGNLDKIMDEIFLKYSENLVNALQEDGDISDEEKEKIISRFCATIISEHLKHSNTKYHPYEIYFNPPLKESITTGDILLNTRTQKRKIILTPACDLEMRADGKRKVNTVLLADVEESEVLKSNCFPDKKSTNFYSELKSKKLRDYYEYLPLSNEKGLIIDFSMLSSVKIEELDGEYKREME